MRALLMLMLLGTKAMAGDYQVVQTLEKPTHVENPILILDNNRPPYVHIKPGKLLWITFNREITECGKGSNKFTITKLGPGGEAVTDGAVKRIKVLADPKTLGNIKKVMDTVGGGSIYELEDDNINCLFADGDIKFFKVKITDRPHLVVKFIDKADDPSKFDMFRAMDGAPSHKIEEDDGIELIPIYKEMEEDGGPVLIRHIEAESFDPSLHPIEDDDRELPAEGPRQEDRHPDGRIMISDRGNGR